MPETEGFDLSNLASILQNEDTLRSLRQMAGAMGMENQLEGALQNLSQSQASASDTGAAASTASAHHQQDHPRENYPRESYPRENYPRENYPSENYPRENYPSENHPSHSQIPVPSDGSAGLNLNSLLSNPALLRTLSSVMQAMNQQGPEYIFLKSLKPLLRPEKGPRVDQAMQIMQMVKALETVEGGGLSGLSGLFGQLGLSGHS